MLRMRVKGLMLEKLTVRATEEGARFKKIARTGAREAVYCTDARGAKILAALCERYSLDFALVSRTGMDAFFHKLRARWTLVFGIALLFALLHLFSSRVWKIDVAFVGARDPAIAQEDVLSLLKDEGIEIGGLKSAIDPSLLQIQLEARTDALSFVGIRKQGVRLFVEVASAIDAPEIFDIDRARDLVASSDGIVVSVNALSGEACVSPGDVVRRGDTLIRGEEMETKETTRGVAALGEVIVRAWIVEEGEIPLYETVYTPTGRKSTSAKLALMGSSIALFEGESYALRDISVEILPVGGLFLPLEIIRTTQTELAQSRVPADAETAKAQIATLLFSEIDASIEGIGADVRQIVDKWIDYSMIEGDLLHARAVVEIHRQVAVTRDTLLQGG